MVKMLYNGKSNKKHLIIIVRYRGSAGLEARSLPPSRVESHIILFPLPAEKTFPAVHPPSELFLFLGAGRGKGDGSRKGRTVCWKQSVELVGFREANIPQHWKAGFLAFLF